MSLISNSKTEGENWIYQTCALYFQPKKRLSIDKWVQEEAFYLPSNTAAPGPYSIDRAPYQREILEKLSPDDPAKCIVMVFGSQMGKTTIENIAMCYYIKENPVPIGFAFSDEDNLKLYVKHKFDPMLNANPQIKAMLRSEGGGNANNLTSKEFPGGFLKFLSGKSEASMRSDSLCLVIADELDAMGITKGGDVKSLLEKRTNTFRESAKICLSSTPLNDSQIYKYLQDSTFKKYYVKCPHCKEYMAFEIDYLRWRLKGSYIVDDAWMECPHCNGIIHNEDKLFLLSPESGARWISTNPNADPTYEGYYLPTFYAPVGWTSWKEIAQEYVTAAFTDKGVDHALMTSLYNTIFGMPYMTGATSAQEWRMLYDKALDSEYVRKQVPNWVNIITTGADVQKNRVEVSVYGWGMLGKSMAIDHFEIPFAENEMDIPTSDAWLNYTMLTLDYQWERDDGLMMRSIANAIDSSYKPDLVYSYWLSLPKEHQSRLFPIKGKDNLKGFLSSKKYVKSEGLAGAFYLDVPVSSLKHHLFDHLKETLKKGQSRDSSFYMEFPNDFSQEYYQQLYGEVYVKEKKKWLWIKVRDRNEVLDCTVYNLAMFYHLGLGNLSREDWEGLALSQMDSLKESIAPFPKKKKRNLSKGKSL